MTAPETNTAATGMEKQIERVITALDSVREWSSAADYRRRLAIAEINALATQPAPAVDGGS